MKNFVLASLYSALLLVGVSCSSTSAVREVRVSVRDQKMALIEDGSVKKTYPVSTSKFCLSDKPGSNGTPVGRMAICSKIGAGQPAGMAFKARHATGEIVKANAPGRDIITSRILRLSGREASTARAYSRCIYIHGTPEERFIGSPASYGCIRMKNRDIIDLFDRVGTGTPVVVTAGGLNGSRSSSTPNPEPTPTYDVPRPATRPSMGPPVVPTGGQSLMARNSRSENSKKTIR
jgi:hypothetical protein